MSLTVTLICLASQSVNALQVSDFASNPSASKASVYVDVELEIRGTVAHHQLEQRSSGLVLQCVTSPCGQRKTGQSVRACSPSATLSAVST